MSSDLTGASAAQPHDTCEFCSGKIEARVIRARFEFRGQTIYVANVPAWVCTKCAETYFDAPVYKRLEDIARHQSQIENTICFPLAEYTPVAN